MLKFSSSLKWATDALWFSCVRPEKVKYINKYLFNKYGGRYKLINAESYDKGEMVAQVVEYVEWCWEDVGSNPMYAINVNPQVYSNPNPIVEWA